MPEWDRRQVLWTLLGASALPLVGGCGSAARIVTRQKVESVSIATLRALADELIRDYGDASVLSRLDEVASSMSNDDERLLARETRRWVRLRASARGQQRDVWTNDLSMTGLQGAASELRRLLGPGKETRASTRTLDSGPEARPKGFPSDAALRKATDAIYRDLQRLPSSRLIRRLARIDSLERRDLFIDAAVERRQRYVHHRSTASVIAWTGTVPATASISSGSSDLSEADLTPERLRRIEEWALALLTAREVEEGETRLVLSPLVSAVLFGACLAPCLDGNRWLSGTSALGDRRNQALASKLVTVTDDPSGRGFAALRFDDDGRSAEPATLVERGEVRASLGGDGAARARRFQKPLSTWTGSPSHMKVTPGALSLSELVAGVDKGVLVDGPISASVDPATLAFNLRASRGLGINNKTLSGRLFGNLEIRGSLRDVLTQVTALSSEAESLPIMLGDDDLRPQLVSAPGATTTAFLGRG